MNFNKLIKSFLIIEFSLFLVNASNYLMLSNTNFYEYFLLKQNDEKSIIEMFNFNWQLSNMIFYLMLILTILIMIFSLIKLIKRSDD